MMKSKIFVFHVYGRHFKLVVEISSSFLDSRHLYNDKTCIDSFAGSDFERSICF